MSRTSELARFPDGGRTYLQAAVDAVVRAGFVVHEQSLSAGSPDSPRNTVERWVSECDVFVTLAGFKYGSLVPGLEISYTEFEWDVATHLRKLRLALVVDSEHGHYPYAFSDESDPDKVKQRAFTEKLRAAVVYKPFSSPEHVYAELLTALSAKGPGAPGKDRPPPLPLDEARRYIARLATSKLDEIDDRLQWSHGLFTELKMQARLDSEVVDLTTSVLTNTRQPVVRIEGEGGSGKSTALRSVARQLCARIAGGKADPAPVLVDLARLTAPPDSVSADDVGTLIRDTVVRSTTGGDAELLAGALATARRHGALFLLFDAFDEIPGLLAATESDPRVNRYSDAVGGYIDGSGCRAVVASRDYRRPSSGGARYRILRLSPQQRDELVSRAEDAGRLGSGPASVIRLGLRSPDLVSSIAQKIDNPHFLAQLCQYVESTRVFPSSANDVSENALQASFARIDDEQERRRVRRTAAEIAGCMALDSLSKPTPQLLDEAMAGRGLTSGPELKSALDLLDGQARLLSPVKEAGNTGLTWSHRLAQGPLLADYLAEHGVEVPPEVLLTDATWRENVVAMLQRGTPKLLCADVVHAASTVCASWAAWVPASPEPGRPIEPQAYPWPTDSRHVLGMLSEAYSGRNADVPGALATSVDTMLDGVMSKRYLLTDRFDAVSACGAASPAGAERTLLAAISGESYWLRDVAYHQILRLRPIPEELFKEMRRDIVRALESGRLWGRTWSSFKWELTSIYRGDELLKSAHVVRRFVLSAAILYLFVAISGAVIGGWRWCLLSIAVVAVDAVRIRLPWGSGRPYVVRRMIVLYVYLFVLAIASARLTSMPRVALAFVGVPLFGLVTLSASLKRATTEGYVGRRSILMWPLAVVANGWARLLNWTNPRSIGRLAVGLATYGALVLAVVRLSGAHRGSTWYPVRQVGAAMLPVGLVAAIVLVALTVVVSGSKHVADWWLLRDVASSADPLRSLWSFKSSWGLRRFLRILRDRTGSVGAAEAVAVANVLARADQAGHRPGENRQDRRTRIASYAADLGEDVQRERFVALVRLVTPTVLDELAQLERASDYRAAGGPA